MSLMQDDTTTRTESARTESARTEPAAPAPAAAQEIAALKAALAKRDWLLESLERQHAAAPGQAGIERRRGLSGDEFVERYYARARPVILQGEMDGWPALTRWTPEYLKSRIGSRQVEFQGSRNANPEFEWEKDNHRYRAPFDAFLDAIVAAGTTNDAYLTAYNSDSNADALAPLTEDLGFLDKFLSRETGTPHGMPWIGPAGTLTPLHHDLTNNLIAQIVGRKAIKLLPAGMAGRVYNDRHVFSSIGDLEDPGLDLSRFPRLNGATVYDIVLEPGDILFVPLGWWHQVRALDFSVTITYTNFRWPNNWYEGYPSG